MRKLNVILITLALCLSGCENSEDHQAIREEIIDGVRIVHNLEIVPKVSENPIQFVEDLIIGNDESNEHYMFNYPADIEADQDGNIYILDWRDCVVKKYNSRGEHVKTWGGRGQGPGEFVSPFCLLIDKNSQVMVVDPGSRRIEVFNTDGGHLQSIKLEHRTDQISRGSMPIIGFSNSGDSTYNVGFYSIDTSEFIQIFSKERPRSQRIMNNEFKYEYPFFVRWAINSKNNVYIGTPDDYIISVFNPKGELSFKFTKPFSLRYLSGEELESVMKTLESLNQNPDRNSIKRLTYPVFNRITIDEKDRIWIEHYEPKWENRSRKDTQYDVFSPKGKFLSNAKINGHVNPELVFKNGYVYALIKQESGYTQAVRFLIVESKLN